MKNKQKNGNFGKNVKTSSAPAESSGKTRSDASGKWKQCLQNAS